MTPFRVQINDTQPLWVAGEGYLEMTGYATRGQTMLSNVLMFLRLSLSP